MTVGDVWPPMGLYADSDWQLKSIHDIDASNLKVLNKILKLKLGLAHTHRERERESLKT